MDMGLFPRRGGWAAALALPVLAMMASPAFATDIADVKLAPITLPQLEQRLHSSTALQVTLTDKIASEACEGAVKVARITMWQTDAGLSPTKVFEFDGNDFAYRASCSEIWAPLRFAPKGTFTVVVKLADGTVLTKENIIFAGAAGGNPSAPIAFDVDVLQGDKDGKLGLAVHAKVDLSLTKLPIIDHADGHLTFDGESAISGDSLAFKEAVKLDSLFAWRFGPTGDYYAIVAKPIVLEGDDNLRHINYKGSLGVAATIPGSVDFGRTLQGLFGDCHQATHNCTSNGLTVGASYALNSKFKREKGRLDRSDDTVTVFQAVWDLPITERIKFSAAYNWQSDSPDGSSSESSEVGVTVTPWGCKSVGVKLSFINGEFLPGQQKRDAVRLGLTSLLGAASGRAGC